MTVGLWEAGSNDWSCTTCTTVDSTRGVATVDEDVVGSVADDDHDGADDEDVEDDDEEEEEDCNDGADERGRCFPDATD
jgi:hypothetical protein